ncbi:MAG: CBS domain-containing protein [Bdellovibrionales bacterium]|nr:CBS domain-containing protein [Bdellovibrionales bacterium]
MTTLQETLIGSVMTPMPHSIGIEQTAAVAQKLMNEFNIRHLPVREGGEVVGIVSDRDISFAIAAEHKGASDLTISDILTAEPVTVGPKTKLANVVKKMADEHIGCVLVIEKGDLVGIYTTTDVCRDFSHYMHHGEISHTQVAA